MVILPAAFTSPTAFPFTNILPTFPSPGVVMVAGFSVVLEVDCFCCFISTDGLTPTSALAVEMLTSLRMVLFPTDNTGVISCTIPHIAKAGYTIP